MSAKQRLSASVDAELLRAGEAAVAAGRASNLSQWVNDALRLKQEHDRRLVALAAFVEAFEAEHGVITDDEMRAAVRRARARAVPVRGRRSSRPRRKRAA